MGEDNRKKREPCKDKEVEGKSTDKRYTQHWHQTNFVCVVNNENAGSPPLPPPPPPPPSPIQPPRRRRPVRRELFPAQSPDPAPPSTPSGQRSQSPVSDPVRRQMLEYNRTYLATGPQLASHGNGNYRTYASTAWSPGTPRNRPRQDLAARPNQQRSPAVRRRLLGSFEEFSHELHPPRLIAMEKSGGLGTAALHAPAPACITAPTRGAPATSAPTRAVPNAPSSSPPRANPAPPPDIGSYCPPTDENHGPRQDAYVIVHFPASHFMYRVHRCRILRLRVTFRLRLDRTPPVDMDEEIRRFVMQTYLLPSMDLVQSYDHEEQQQQQPQPEQEDEAEDSLSCPISAMQQISLDSQGEEDEAEDQD